jgi:hypothetical protein
MDMHIYLFVTITVWVVWYSYSINSMPLFWYYISLSCCVTIVSVLSVSISCLSIAQGVDHVIKLSYNSFDVYLFDYMFAAMMSISPSALPSTCITNHGSIGERHGCVYASQRACLFDHYMSLHIRLLAFHPMPPVASHIPPVSSCHITPSQRRSSGTQGPHVCMPRMRMWVVCNGVDAT